MAVILNFGKALFKRDRECILLKMALDMFRGNAHKISPRERATLDAIIADLEFALKQARRRRAGRSYQDAVTGQLV